MKSEDDNWFISRCWIICDCWLMWHCHCPQDGQRWDDSRQFSQMMKPSDAIDVCEVIQQVLDYLRLLGSLEWTLAKRLGQRVVSLAEICLEGCSPQPSVREVSQCCYPPRERGWLSGRAPGSCLKGCAFKSSQERWENFIPQGQLSVLTLISVSVPPLCYLSST